MVQEFTRINERDPGGEVLVHPPVDELASAIDTFWFTTSWNYKKQEGLDGADRIGKAQSLHKTLTSRQKRVSRSAR